MTGLARAAVTRPRLMLASWLAGMALLVIIGLHVEEHLHRTNIDIPGSGSDRAADLELARFGTQSDLVVLLRGPRAELDRQGRRLAAALERRERISVLDPWSPNVGDALRPRRGSALLVVRSHSSFEEVSREVVADVRSDVDRLTAAPVEANVSGYPDIGAGIYRTQVDAIARAELIAVPVLIVVLLLVFRSVVAAGLLLLAGSTTIAAARGVLEILNGFTPLDPVALNLASMLGLALAVDYALLLVTRFQAELAGGSDPRSAGLVSAETAGRTILIAGVALGLAMLIARLTAPGDLLSSASTGLVVAVVLSVVTGITALPAALVLLGHGINRWNFGGRTERTTVATLALRALRRPVIAGSLVLALLVALAAPALGLQTGPPDPRVLPEDSRERADWETVRDVLGGGWAAPYEITVATDRGPITTPRRLAELDRWQRRLAKDPDVLTVLGVSALEDESSRRRAISERLLRTLRAARPGSAAFDQFEQGLAQVEFAVRALQGGLGQGAQAGGALAGGAAAAARGADAAVNGAEALHAGAGELFNGLGLAHTGVDQLVGGLRRARGGVRALHGGLARAHEQGRAGLPRLRELAGGLARGADDVRRLREPTGVATSSLGSAREGLDRMLPTSKVDPAYRDVVTAVATAQAALSGLDPRTGERVDPDYPGLDASLTAAADGLDTAAAGIRQLVAELVRFDAGLLQLMQGATRLEAGLARMQTGAGALRTAMAALRDGEGRLANGVGLLASETGRLGAGIGELADGARRLEAGLASGAERAEPVAPGVRRMRLRIAAFRAETGRLGGALSVGDAFAPLLSSGYGTLAAIDADKPARRAASFAINVDRGGSAARIIVVERRDPRRAGNALRGRLDRQAADVARAAGGTAGVGGPAALLQDFDEATGSGTLWRLLALLAVTYFVLVLVVRSLIVPLLAVVLGVLTVLAGFGAVELLFEGDDPLLGGPGFVDAIMATGIFTLAFGLSIDYEVFLLARMREGFRLTGTTEGAIEYALHHTARVISGAAVIMTAVFASFTLPEVASMRQLGIGLAVAILLDATLVRLVLLPAAIRLAGPGVWRLPAWLDRVLPRVEPDDATLASSSGRFTPPSGRP
ncbi:MAG TPA: MMPL family transporter [Thermoleophilaceae bacterium]|nr:MMPL family transporter [Thermoleophilaceae bacterium]